MEKNMDNTFKELFNAELNKIDIKLSDSQIDKFEKYYNHLIEKNKVMNLTAITEINDVIKKHFIDSIVLLKYYDISDKKIIDVGTGAGFPGIPLAILFPDAEFTLMDSLNKRIGFLNEVIELCDLGNVETVHSRAEDLGRNSQYREKFDICVSRAVANLSTLLEYCIPFVKVNGYFISYKSAATDEEIEMSKNAQNKLLCKFEKKSEFVLPNTDMYRTFLFFRKTNNTNKTYPRQAGKPKKNPL